MKKVNKFLKMLLIAIVSTIVIISVNVPNTYADDLSIDTILDKGSKFIRERE